MRHPPTQNKYYKTHKRYIDQHQEAIQNNISHAGLRGELREKRVTDSPQKDIKKGHHRRTNIGSHRQKEEKEKSQENEKDIKIGHHRPGRR